MLRADLVLSNGNIITMNRKKPTAQALAIYQGRFLAIGNSKLIDLYLGENTKKIDLKGKTVVPGFIDTHVHGAALGRDLSRLDLHEVKSIKEIQQRIKSHTSITAKGRWIIGYGFDQDRLAENRYPLREDLDQIAPHHPVLILRVCGHLGVVNTRAMELAGISIDTTPPKGGLIDREPEMGEPNGVLRENALDIIYNALPKPTDEELSKTCLRACQKMIQQGLTTVHWVIGSASEIRVLQQLNTKSILPLRIYVIWPIEHLNHVVRLGLSTGFGDERIKIGAMKILADGSLGARTAALKQPYQDSPSANGIILYPKEELKRLVEKAHNAGLQLAIHAIGDKTIETTLQILEEVIGEMPKRKHRHRLEHASVLNPSLIDKMKDIGILASVQPHFAISDFWVVRRLGKTRARWTYAFKSLMEKGIVTMGSSDAPVEPVSPLLGIFAAVAREMFPQERLSIEEALKLYTINAAYGSFEESMKGSIEKGKLADLVVLSKNPLKISPDEIKNVEVLMTIVGGMIVHTSNMCAASLS